MTIQELQDKVAAADYGLKPRLQSGAKHSVSLEGSAGRRQITRRGTIAEVANELGIWLDGYAQGHSDAD